MAREHGRQHLLDFEQCKISRSRLVTRLEAGTYAKKGDGYHSDYDSGRPLFATHTRRACEHTCADEPNAHAKTHAHLLPHLLETPVQKKLPMNHTNLGIVGTTDFCQILGISGQFPKPNFPAIQKQN